MIFVSVLKLWLSSVIGRKLRWRERSPFLKIISWSPEEKLSSMVSDDQNWRMTSIRYFWRGGLRCMRSMGMSSGPGALRRFIVFIVFRISCAAGVEMLMGRVREVGDVWGVAS